jgi:hypothetical protein
MKVRKKSEIGMIHVEPEDTIELDYTQTVVDGTTTTTTTKKVMSEKIGRPMYLDTAVIFDVEKGDFSKEVQDGIGGAFLKTKKTS